MYDIVDIHIHTGAHHLHRRGIGAHTGYYLSSEYIHGRPGPWWCYARHRQEQVPPTCDAHIQRIEVRTTSTAKYAVCAHRQGAVGEDWLEAFEKRRELKPNALAPQPHQVIAADENASPVSSEYRYDGGCVYCFGGQNSLFNNNLTMEVLSMTTPLTVILHGDWCCKTHLPPTSHQVIMML
jgi:hypothetical protein